MVKPLADWPKREHDQRFLAWFIVVMAVVMSIVLVASAALAQSPPNDERGPWRRTLVQGAMLARIIVSERSDVLRTDSFNHDELDWFASVVINNRPSFRAARGWSDVLGMLAPHVTGYRPPVRDRHHWTSTLQGCTEAQPTGWDRARDGNWDLYGLRWQSFCIEVRERWVRGEFTINSDAIAWGNIGDAKRHLCQMSSRGLCPIAWFKGINERANLFFGRAGDASCNEALRESFVEAHCEGRR